MAQDFLSQAIIAPMDWASWLNSIEKHPHDHQDLVLVDEEIRFLNSGEWHHLMKEGRCVHRLSMSDILNITQKIFKDPVLKALPKKGMWEGVRYIQDERQKRFDSLFWLIKWLAKMCGVEATLKEEKKAVDALKKEAGIIVGIPILNYRVIKEEESIASQLKGIKKQCKVLADKKKTLNHKSKEGWFEEFFQCEKELMRLRFNHSEAQLKPFINEIKALEKQLDQWNAEMPRLKQLVKAYGKRALKGSLLLTLESLCQEKKISPFEKARDKALYQCSELELCALFVKRLIKTERTQLSLSLISAIERTWKEIAAGPHGGVTKLLEGYRVIFCPIEGEIYLKEGYLSKGSNKAVFLLTAYHTLKKVDDRCKLVILQPIHAVEKEIAECEESFDGSAFSHSQISDSPQNELEFGDSESSQKVGSSETPIAEDAETTDDENMDYKIEAEKCLRYGKLPGIWPTHKVIDVDGNVGILQPAAGFPVEGTDEDKRTAISLADMGILMKEKLLSKKDQLALVDMIGDCLKGVESLHEEDLIHRDLKASNILCADAGTAGVSDFGTLCANKILSKEPNHLSEDASWVANPEKAMIVGSPYYIAPEVICYHSVDWSKIGTPVDIWGIGLILWECLSGKALLDHPLYKAIGSNPKLSALMMIMKIGELLSTKKQIYKLFYKEPKVNTLSHLIWRCTRAEPQERPLLSEVIAFYESWAKYAKRQMMNGKIQSLQECMDDCVT